MNRKSSLSVIFVALGSALGLACHMVSAQAPEVSLPDSTLPQLLQPTELVHLTSRIIGPEVVRRQGVKVDFELLKTLDPEGDNQIVFNLFPGTTFTGRVEGKTFPCKLIGFPDAFSLSGSIQGKPGSSFRLLYLQGALAADIRVPGKGEYQIRPTAPNAYEVWKIDNSRFPPCAVGRPDHIIPLPADKAQAQSTPSLVDVGSVIDVMIAYTTDARLAVGGEINVILESAFAVIHANEALANSAINTRLQFVYMQEISYPESGSASTDLNRLTNISDGFLDNLHFIRDVLAADIVSLFVASLDACGTSWQMSDVSPDFQSSAFNVCAIRCAAVNLTYAHEVGHILGCQHNREDAGGNLGVFPYSFGYLEPSGSFRTILGLPNGSPRIMQFSNPLVQVNGVPTGVPEGQINSADNAKTINNTALTVANFRQSVNCSQSVNFDCNSNCIEDTIDILNGTSLDCNANGIPDECEDCNNNGIADSCDLANGSSSDCNSNSIPDDCEVDCNGNGIPDTCDIADGTSFDCNSNSVPDICDIFNGTSFDCNFNRIPDECEDDCNSNCIEDAIDISRGTSLDCNANGIPDECEEDCNGNGIPDTCDLADRTSFDCNFNTIPDECEDDCNGNGFFDACDIADGISSDCNFNSIPDECEGDCNRNGIPDPCDLADGTSSDCNSNTIPDTCDIANGTSSDCNRNRILDECDLADGTSFDCNSNTIPDTCDIDDGRSSDCNSNTIPDECDVRRVTSNFTSISGELSPIGLGFPVSHTLTRPPAAQGDVTLRFAAIADIGSIFQLLDVYLNDVFLEQIFRFNGTFCPTTPDEDQLVVTKALFNTLVDGGDAVFRIETFDGIAFDACNGTSWVSVSLDYFAPPEVQDVNGNGVPDSCDQAQGDFNLDGIVDVTDLVSLLGVWGICPGCGEDSNSDGIVNVTDLLTLLANWGPLE